MSRALKPAPTGRYWFLPIGTDDRRLAVLGPRDCRLVESVDWAEGLQFFINEDIIINLFICISFN